VDEQQQQQQQKLLFKKGFTMTTYTCDKLFPQHTTKVKLHELHELHVPTTTTTTQSFSSTILVNPFLLEDETFNPRKHFTMRLVSPPPYGKAQVV
jgi:hypothetical protein